MKEYDIPHNAYFGKNYPKGLKDERVHKSNEERYYRIIGLLKELKQISLKDIEEILKDHNNQPMGNDNTICRHGELISTQVSMIFLPKNRKLIVGFNNPCTNPSYEFELD
jgi:hypothetical protein